MSERLTCSNGHDWESSRPGAGQVHATHCPTCGEPALGPQPTLAEDALTTGGYQTGNAPERGAPGAGEGLAVPGYDILEVLGRGGMGIVYKARQTALKRLVALKMIRAGDHDDPALQARFRSEAEAVARLRHANIVQIYEVGETGGQPFFALEYVEGGSLAKKLAGTPQPPREAAALVRTLAQAVSAAHAQGVIHRDLKPANVLLTTEGLPKVADFGLAKQLGDDSGQTQSGAILGTPSYMAPEQAEGRVNAVSPGTDVYALGAILYECLTGRPPFKGATMLETLEQVRTREPVPPAQLQPKVPRDLETICLKCLHKDPAKRYTTAEQLADDLGRFLDGRPILARPVGVLERVYRWCRRNPMAAGFLLTLLLATATTSALTVWALGERDRADRKAQEAQNNAARESAAREDAHREADAAWANQYVAHVNHMESDWENANVARIRDTLGIYRQPPPGRKDLRGWEWHYQDRLCNHEVRTLLGHTDTVTSVAFSPDGMWFASAGADRILKLWDTATGRELCTLQGHTREVMAVAISSDATRVASASLDGTVMVWEVSRARRGEAASPLLILKGHTRELRGVAFSPDGTRLASAGYDRTVRVWDVTPGRTGEVTSPLLTLTQHSAPVLAVAFSPDGTRLASGGAEGVVRLWDASSGLELRRLKAGPGTVNSVAFSPDGSRLVSAQRTLKFWDATNGQELATLKEHTNDISKAAFSPDGAWLATGGFDGVVRLWDARTGQELRAWRAGPEDVRGLAFSPEGAWLVSAHADGTVRLWNAARGQEPRIVKGQPFLWGVAFSPDGAWLALAHGGGTVTLVDRVTGKELRTLKGHTGGVTSVAFSRDATWLASASFDESVRLWDPASGRRVNTLQGHTGTVRAVAFSPDPETPGRLASASQDGTIRLWDAASGQLQLTLSGHTRAIWKVAFSPDGKRLASASHDHTVMVWDVATTQAEAASPVLTLKGHAGQVMGVAFSPDGNRLASAALDGSVKLWDVSPGRAGETTSPLLTIKGHSGGVSDVSFSQDGTRLASAGIDLTVRLSDAATGRELRNLKSKTGVVRGVAFSRDGAWLASAGERGVELRDARPLTPEVKAETEALALVEFLFERPLGKNQVLAAIRRDLILSDPARRKALELAERFKEETDLKKYHDAAWGVIRHRYSNVFVCRFALAQVNAACERAPDDAAYRRALAVAQYRLGRFQKERYAEALATLAKCDQGHPTTLAMLAMTRHQLGQKEPARATLARLGEVMKAPLWSGHIDANAFQREAGELIEGGAGPRKQ